MKDPKVSIVIADDDEDDHYLVKQAMQEVGMEHSTISVFTGLQLMDLLLKKGAYKDTDHTVDIILLDLNMPRMDGFQALQKIRANKTLKQIPIYILSTSRLDEDRARSAELGANGFYTKPILFNQLKAIIEDIFSKQGGA